MGGRLTNKVNRPNREPNIEWRREIEIRECRVELAANHGWVRVEREVRPRTGLALIHVATCLAYLRHRGRKWIARGMSEDRASWYARNQRMTTAETWATRRKVGPAVAAENGIEACSAVVTEIEKDERG